MKSTTLALALGLFGGTALAGAATAQTPPAPKPPAPAAPTPAAQPQTATQTAPAQQTPPTPQPQQSAQAAQPSGPTPSGPPEGMVVETPNGFYLVRPGDQPPQHLDLGRNGGRQMAQQGQGGMDQRAMDRPGVDRPMVGQNGPMGMDDDMQGDMADGGMQPPPRPRRPPPRPAQGKGASLHIHAPNLDVDVKCPDDEPVKACVDAISQLLDKTTAAAH